MFIGNKRHPKELCESVRHPNEGIIVSEAFQPIAVRPPSENRLLFWVRCLADLQLLTIFRFLVLALSSCRGRVLDVGAGEAPWRDLLPVGVEYVGVDADLSGEFGMRRQSNIIYYDGKRLPFDDASFDHVLCIEVLEHVPDPSTFLADLKRVLRQGGTLILTVPWSARLHHLPYDYSRFTRFGLVALLDTAGFSGVTIEERGNDIAVIANKLIVLMIRLLRPRRLRNCVWTWVLAAMLLPVTVVFLGAAHVALLLCTGSKEDPLGYGVIAVKT
jgi:SAM-dependent methyltransferase